MGKNFLSVFISLFCSVCSQDKINGNRDHKHNFIWLTSLIRKFEKWKMLHKLQRNYFWSFTDIAKGNNINTSVNT